MKREEWPSIYLYDSCEFNEHMNGGSELRAWQASSSTPQILLNLRPDLELEETMTSPFIFVAFYFPTYQRYLLCSFHATCPQVSSRRRWLGECMI